MAVQRLRTQATACLTFEQLQRQLLAPSCRPLLEPFLLEVPFPSKAQASLLPADRAAVYTSFFKLGQSLRSARSHPRPWSCPRAGTAAGDCLTLCCSHDPGAAPARALLRATA